MSAPESVTGWLADLKNGRSEAAQQLWQRYVCQLIRLANDRLAHSPRRMADEEDVVAVAFASFLRGVADNRFAKLHDRDDLWQILIVLTERKAIDQMRREQAARRGGGQVRGESALEVSPAGASSVAGLGHVADARPTPEFAVQLADQLQQLLAALADGQLQTIAIDKLEGYTNKEVACRRNMSLRSVERQLQLIRRIWDRESMS